MLFKVILFSYYVISITLGGRPFSFAVSSDKSGLKPILANLPDGNFVGKSVAALSCYAKNLKYSETKSTYAFCPLYPGGHYSGSNCIEINLGKTYSINGIEIKTRKNVYQWVTTYTLEYMNTQSSSYVKVGAILPGNDGYNKKLFIRFGEDSIFSTNKIKICPRTFYGWPSFQLELYGKSSTFNNIESQKLSYKEANEYCKRMYGTNLFVIKNLDDQQKVVSKMNFVPDDIWIGVYFDPFLKRMKSLNGQPFLNTKWKPGQPQITGHVEKCVAVDKPSYGLWENDDCGVPKYFICEQKNSFSYSKQENNNNNNNNNNLENKPNPISFNNNDKIFLNFENSLNMFILGGIILLLLFVFGNILFFCCIFRNNKDKTKYDYSTVTTNTTNV